MQKREFTKTKMENGVQLVAAVELNRPIPEKIMQNKVRCLIGSAKNVFAQQKRFLPIQESDPLGVCIINLRNQQKQEANDKTK